MAGFVGTAIGLSLQAKALAGGSTSFTALATSLFTTACGGVAAALIAVMTFNLEAGIPQAAKACLSRDAGRIACHARPLVDLDRTGRSLALRFSVVIVAVAPKTPPQAGVAGKGRISVVGRSGASTSTPTPTSG